MIHLNSNTERVEIAVYFGDCYLFGANLSFTEPDVNVKSFEKRACEAFKRAVHGNVKGEIRKKLTLSAVAGDRDLLRESIESGRQPIARPSVFLPVMRKPFDGDLIVSPFDTAAAYLHLSYTSFERIRTFVSEELKGHELSTDEVFAKTIDAFRAATGIDVVLHGGCIGARAVFERLPTFDLHTQLSFDSEREPSIYVVSRESLAISRSKDAEYSATAVLRSAGGIVWENTVSMDPVTGALFRIPRDCGPVDDAEIVVREKLAGGEFARLWEFRAPLVRSIHINMGMGGMVKRELQSRLTSQSKKRRYAVRDLQQTQPIHAGPRRGDPWVDWHRVLRRTVGREVNESLEQRYFTKEERSDFWQWMQRRFGSVKHVSVLDPYFNLDGAADLFDVSSEERFVLDVVTTESAISGSGGTEDRETVRRTHAETIIRASGSPESSVSYLKDEKFHDRYVVLDGDESPVVLSLSNSWNGALLNHDLFVQQLSHRNALMLLRERDRLRNKARTSLSGADFPELFKRRVTSPSIERPSNAEVAAAWDGFVHANSDEAPSDADALIAKLSTIVAADYHGESELDSDGWNALVRRLETVPGTAFETVVHRVLERLEDGRRKLEREGRRLDTRVFGVRPDDPSYWLDRVEIWGRSSRLASISDTGWSPIYLSLFSLLLAARLDNVARIAEAERVPEELMAAAWFLVAEWLHSLPDEANSLGWPLPRLWRAYRDFERLLYPANGRASEFNPAEFVESIRSVTESLPPEERYCFRGHADRRIATLRGAENHSRRRQLDIELVDRWEQSSLDYLAESVPEQRVEYARERFGPLFDNDPEGAVRFLGRFSENDDLALLSSAIAGALTSDAKLTRRLLKTLRLPTVDDRESRPRDRFTTRWLRDEYAFSFSHLANLTVSVLGVERIDIGTLERLFRNFRLPPPCDVGVPARSESTDPVAPHLFFCLNVAVYWYLDLLESGREDEAALPDRVQSMIVRLMEHMSTQMDATCQVARFLMFDGGALLLDDAEREQLCRLLPSGAYRALAVSGSTRLIPGLLEELHRLERFSDEIDFLVHVTTAVNLAVAVRGAQMRGTLGRIGRLDEVVSKLRSIGESEKRLRSDLLDRTLEYLSVPEDETTWRALEAEVGSHRSFGVIRAILRGTIDREVVHE